MNEPSLQSTLPASARQAISGEMSKDFQSALKLPKGMNRQMVARAIDQVLLNGKAVESLKTSMGLLPSEADYVSKVVVEFRAWEAANQAPAAPEPAQETA